MKSLKEVQDLLFSNQKADFQAFIDEGISIINSLMTTKYNKPVPRPECDKEAFRSNFLKLMEISRRYINLAVGVNSAIVAYNKHIQANDLPNAKIVAAQIINMYEKHHWRTMRQECGTIRTKKKWLKIHVSLRNDMYSKMDYAAKQLEMAKKIKVRTKRLDVKAPKRNSYWLS